MCGIAGAIATGTAQRSGLGPVVASMVHALRHRGPDSGGIWADDEAGIALGHRRLSILDLSPGGAQPMVSASGRYVISYNGEIYNHLELRDQLGDDSGFRGHSDTESLLAAVERWGLEETLARCVGMFAFGLWDRHKRILHLVRDRVGIKPLYYYAASEALYFGSELGALAGVAGLGLGLNVAVLPFYLAHGYIGGQDSIYTGVRKVEPGTRVEVSERGEVRSIPYWSPTEFWSRPKSDDTPELAEERTLDLLRRSVRQSMLSDVPLGSFLSGGLDSSLVTALMQEGANAPVRTFTIGFAQAGYDESGYASAVAHALGTQHTEYILESSDVLDCVHDLAGVWDEPFADSSQLPMLLLSRLTRKHVKVALSGDGGDELFLGYKRYAWGKAWSWLNLFPRSMRSALSAWFAGVPPWALEPFPLARKLWHRLPLAAADSFDAFYALLTSNHFAPQSLLMSRQSLEVQKSGGKDLYQRMSLLDVRGYLPDDILTKVDRATMSVGLEARVPLLDHRLIEYASSLPSHVHRADGKGKYLLRRLLSRFLPPSLYERPKQGFALPVREWLKKELRPWCQDMLAESTLRRQGILDAAAVQRLWADYCGGREEHYGVLWSVLMLQEWLARHEARLTPPPL